MTTAQGQLILTEDGIVNASVKVNDMPKYDVMSIYLIYNGKTIDSVSKYSRLYAKTIGVNPSATIKITSKNGLDTLFSLNVDYIITINHKYSSLVGVNPSKLYIKIDFWELDLITPSRKPAYITTGTEKTTCSISLNTFKLNRETTYYSYKSPYSVTLKVVEDNGMANIPVKNYKIGEINNIAAGGKYSLTVDYTKPIKYVLAHDRNIRPDGNPATCTYCQFVDFLNNYMWSRVGINSNCNISSTAKLTYWVKYPAILHIVKKPPSSEVIPAIGRDFEKLFKEAFPNVSTPELALGVVALFLIAKIVMRVVP